MDTMKTTSVLAREADGTLQITITIPKSDVARVEQEVVDELAKTTEVPGFRPGHAPVEEVKKRISAQEMLEKILGKLLPAAYQATLVEHKLQPVLSPKFELVSVKQNEDWQIRAITCEVPEVTLGEYQKEIDTAKRSNALWVPGKDPSTQLGAGKKEPSQAEKEQLVLDTLIKTTSVTIPAPLLEEEVNHRLSSFVDQTQKLGMTVEQYLTSTGKTAQTLRDEFTKAAQEELKAMLILSRIAENEEIKVEDQEIEKTLQGNSDKKIELTPTQKQMIGGAIRRRKALDKLTATI
ncbi:hypothetical protein HY405_02335 [Candidatus Microgenomates bacterium]|nr:hypothetical protein [Candidatus Microgenomates bacterium]